VEDNYEHVVSNVTFSEVPYGFWKLKFFTLECSQCPATKNLVAYQRRAFDIPTMTRLGVEHVKEEHDGVFLQVVGYTTPYGRVDLS